MTSLDMLEKVPQDFPSCYAFLLVQHRLLAASHFCFVHCAKPLRLFESTLNQPLWRGTYLSNAMDKAMVPDEISINYIYFTQSGEILIFGGTEV